MQSCNFSSNDFSFPAIVIMFSSAASKLNFNLLSLLNIIMEKIVFMWKKFGQPSPVLCRENSWHHTMTQIFSFWEQLIVVQIFYYLVHCLSGIFRKRFWCQYLTVYHTMQNVYIWIDIQHKGHKSFFTALHEHHLHTHFHNFPIFASFHF